MQDQIRQLEERIKKLENNQIAVIMSNNADTNVYRSLQRTFASPTINVGIGTSNPNQTALLELKSTTSGFMFPRMTQTQRDAITSNLDITTKASAAGLFIYNTTTGKLDWWNGIGWAPVH